MRTMILLLSIYIASVAIVTTACNNSTTSNSTVSENKTDSSVLVKRGEYLVTIGVCDDCHSPKIMGPKGPEVDMERRLSGFPGTRPVPSYNKELMQSGIVQFNELLGREQAARKKEGEEQAGTKLHAHQEGMDGERSRKGPETGHAAQRSRSPSGSGIRNERPVAGSGRWIDGGRSVIPTPAPAGPRCGPRTPGRTCRRPRRCPG